MFDTFQFSQIGLFLFLVIFSDAYKIISSYDDSF